ncbi:hypothetical protein SEA_POLLUX_31 [Gordonia phage Pollux]|nr:hypothetical protein SEA_POLLUX_31 [Gordonia phage Pollux]UVF60464.1 hypothetical protein SEA_MALACHAI_33 [Gordonia phage Malachai]
MWLWYQRYLSLFGGSTSCMASVEGPSGWSEHCGCTDSSHSLQALEEYANQARPK